MNEGQKRLNISKRLANWVKLCKRKLTSMKNCIVNRLNLDTLKISKSKLCAVKITVTWKNISLELLHIYYRFYLNVITFSLILQ